MNIIKCIVWEINKQYQTELSPVFLLLTGLFESNSGFWIWHWTIKQSTFTWSIQNNVEALFLISKQVWRQRVATNQRRNTTSTLNTSTGTRVPTTQVTRRWYFGKVSTWSNSFNYPMEEPSGRGASTHQHEQLWSLWD